MLFIGVEHKDTYFHFALTTEQLNDLKFILDHATINFDSATEPEGVKADKYLHEEFYPTIENIVNGE